VTPDIVGKILKDKTSYVKAHRATITSGKRTWLWALYTYRVLSAVSTHPS